MSETATKSRPILFSSPMVLAILDGRKTQTRRVIKHQPFESNDKPGQWLVYEGNRGGASHYAINERMTEVYSKDGKLLSTETKQIPVAEWILSRCPYGQPGDELWVRETWAVSGIAWGITPSRAAKIAAKNAWRYAADDATGWMHRWKPSIHMPRAASRITLTITNVRVERLREISEADAQAEGCEPALPVADQRWVAGFERLWESINGAGSWQANPWCWAVEFQRKAGE